MMMEEVIAKGREKAREMGLLREPGDLTPQSERSVADRREPKPPAGRCVHLGTEVASYRQCPTCRGAVRLKEFACAVGLGVNGRAVPTLDCGPGKCSGYRVGA